MSEMERFCFAYTQLVVIRGTPLNPAKLNSLIGSKCEIRFAREL